MIKIRSEKPNEYAEISEVYRTAFKQDNEARLVEALRSTPNFIPELSLVAIINGSIVGHILFSRVIIKSKTREFPALALAPMAVRPEHQNCGIGSQLIRKGLKECKRLGHGIVIVVGHPNYYPRFGFKSALAFGLKAPFDVPEDVFLVREVIPGALDDVRGVVIYPPSFDLGL